jgi:hypothetical protein
MKIVRNLSLIFSFCLPLVGEIRPITNSGDWVGKTALEIAPNAKPLGSTKARFFNLVKQQNKKTYEDSSNQDVSDSPGIEKAKTQENILTISSLQSTLEKNSTSESTKKSNWIGLSPYQLSPRSVPLGSLVYKHGMNHEMRQKMPISEDSPTESIQLLNLSVFGGSRAYFTDNVMRTKEAELDSVVWENSVGTSVETRPFELGKYLTLIPRLDFLMQWANYGEKTVNDLLDYRFGMVKGGLNFYLPRDFAITTGLEYTFLHSQFTGDKLFHSVSPSISLQKIHSFSDNTFLMLDALLKYSKTTREINFVADNIFPDDGDNIQATLNFNLIHTMGRDGQIIFMPGIGINRTEYLKNTQDGRVDLTYFAGISLIWQIWDWVGLQVFSNYSLMDTNSLGKKILGESSSYKALDTGASINVNHSF